MPKSLSIDEFCEAEGISRGYWYVMAKSGKTPETYQVGKLVRISPEAHQAWREARKRVAA
jgi:excisionase family DNA binding protein